MTDEPLPESRIDKDSAPLTEADRIRLNNVEPSLKKGVEVKEWWEKKAGRSWTEELDAERVDELIRSGVYSRSFNLIQEFNRPEDASYGFFDSANIGGTKLDLMAVDQQMFYDQPKLDDLDRVVRRKVENLGDKLLDAYKGNGGGAVTKKLRTAVKNTLDPKSMLAELRADVLKGWNEDLREFVLGYFARVTDFRRPEPSVEHPHHVPELLQPLSWCPEDAGERRGFGYLQVYYKRADNGKMGMFRSQDQARVTDMRNIGKGTNPKTNKPREYEWVVLKVEIFNFTIEAKPLGGSLPYLVVPLKEETYLIVSGDFIVDREHPRPDLLGQYGFGYAMLKDPTAGGPLAYGPGKFAAGIQLIDFRVLRGEDDEHKKEGTVLARAAFVVNRPDQILNLPVNPVDWSFKLAELATFGMGAQLLAPVQRAVKNLPFASGFDPLLASVGLANAVSAGQAAKTLCISKEQLEKEMLITHFMQHYDMLTGSQLTWREVRNWTVPEHDLPQWVVSGRSS